MRKWKENLKVTQARFNKFSIKLYDEKMANIEHNCLHLQNIISEPFYPQHLSLIQKAEGYEEKIEILLKVIEKVKEQEKYFDSRLAGELARTLCKQQQETTYN